MQKLVPGFWRKRPNNQETNIPAILRFENHSERDVLFLFGPSMSFRETTFGDS